MRYLLDANAVIALLNETTSPIARRIRRCAPRHIGVSAVVVHELDYGGFRSQRVEKNVARVAALQFTVLEFDQEDAWQAGEIESASRIEGDAHRSLRCSDCRTGQGAQADARRAQHHGVPTRAGIEGGGLEGSDIVVAYSVQVSEVAGQASLRIAGALCLACTNGRNATGINNVGEPGEPPRNRACGRGRGPEPLA